MPSLRSTRRRHSKQSSSSSSSHKKAAPSIISTASSASSNATVMSKSVLPSNLPPPKRLDAKKEPVKQVNHQQAQSPTRDESNKENLDVFAFLEHDEDEDEGDRGTVEEKDDEDDDDEGNHGTVEEKDDGDDESEEEKLSSSESSSSSSERVVAQPQRSPRYSDLEVRAIQDGVQRVWGRGSLHSDSGISVRSSSPDQGSPIMQHKLPTVFDEPDNQHDPQESYRMGRYGFQLTPDPAADRNLTFGHKHWPSLETGNNQSSNAYYAPSPPLLAQNAHDVGVELSEMSPRLPRRLIRNVSHKEQPRTRASPTGYGYLASNIHSKDNGLLKPIYRKFETLNNRMLLFLQDEICEMEEQLKDLDDAIARDEQSGFGKPSSRRAEAKLPSQLQWHRLELLRRSFPKVEQYNRTLTSYSDMTKSVGSASPADITAYRSWIAKHAPMVESERAFLDKDSDLVSVSSCSVIRSDFRTGTALETPVIVVGFGLLSTIVVFQIVPQIVARLVISAMVGVASLCTLSPEVMNKPGSALNWRKAIATYVVVMGTLAVVVS